MTPRPEFESVTFQQLRCLGSASGIGLHATISPAPGFRRRRVSDPPLLLLPRCTLLRCRSVVLHGEIHGNRVTLLDIGQRRRREVDDDRAFVSLDVHKSRLGADARDLAFHGVPTSHLIGPGGLRRGASHARHDDGSGDRNCAYALHVVSPRSPACADLGNAARADGWTSDLFAARTPPLPLEILGVLVRAGCHPEDDAAVLDALLVQLRAVFRNTSPNEGPNQGTQCPAGSRTG